ncbi:DUF4115 domain-containing protein [Pelagibius litoralis]|uniref:DUF4115 domain-containing protein n=1 Tax=Pelagibius litoralis TaxID=374515 RepID=A0A967F2A7_9PROT|nr:RodZ domain-containing protein [Pelagibius litoralis]NIA71868.1 DUF4115 domain-containing protein [Pelagibius litoralis]
MAQTAKKSAPKRVDRDPVPEIAIAQELEGEKVADTLIRARQQYGQDLRSIAQVLCIRYSYLDAIERANYESLPGPTYAVGFVRTYAEFLGLDGDAIVERFKNEVQGLDGQPKLHFPTPAPEGKMPGGAVFLVAALLFAAAYGVWFYLSNKGETIADLVSPVPERLQELVEDAPPETLSETPPAAAESPVVAAATPESTVPESAVPENAQPENATPESAAEAIQPPASGLAPETPSEASDQTVTAESSAASSSTPSAAEPTGQVVDADGEPRFGAPLVEIVPDAETPSAAAPERPGTDGTAATPSQPAPVQPEPVVTLPQPETPANADQSAYAIPAAPANDQASSFLVNQEPQVYGGDNTDARVVLKANQDAWVQVRDREGTLLLTRVLRVGDSYRVPNQEDLTLLTGNAGGLEILVDGNTLAPLGPVGAVRRNIPLDPEQLLSGGAQ